MANSWANTQSTGVHDYALTLTISLASQSIEGNYSVINWTLSCAGSWGASSGPSGAWSAALGAGTTSGPGPAIHGSYWVVASGQTVVGHRADGTQSYQAFGSYQSGHGSVGSATVYVDVVLPTIPRASVASIVGGNIVSAGSTVTVKTNPASADFRHDLTYSVDGGHTFTNIALAVTDQAQWAPALSLIDQFPNTASAPGFIRCRTFSAGQLVGQVDSVFTLAAPANVVPTISGATATDLNGTVKAAIGAFVQGLSQVRVDVNAAGTHGSTIQAASFVLDGATAQSGQAVTVPNAGPRPVSASAADSRGRVGTWTGTVPVLPYATPSISNVTIQRCNTDGTLNDAGTSLKVTANATVQSLKPAATEKNTASLTVSTRTYGGTSWTARGTYTIPLDSSGGYVKIIPGTYSADTAHDVRLELSDATGSMNAAQSTVPTQVVLMHWAKTGMGVGKIWQQGSIDAAGQIFQNSGKTVLDDTSTLSAAKLTGVAPLATVPTLDMAHLPVQRGTESTPSGTSAGSSGGIYWTPAATVTFPTAFSAAPSVVATFATALSDDPGQIAWVTLGKPTTTGFQYRVCRVTAIPEAGQIHWTATP